MRVLERPGKMGSCLISFVSKAAIQQSHCIVQCCQGPLCWYLLEPCTPVFLMFQATGSTESSKSSCPLYPLGRRQNPSLTTCRNGLEFLSIGARVKSALPLCLGNCPLQTGAEAAFLKELPFLIVFPCNSCTYVSRVGVSFPSQLLTSSLWSHR